MNKSPQYNQQTEPKQCKTEVQEICVYKICLYVLAVTTSIYI